MRYLLLLVLPALIACGSSKNSLYKIAQPDTLITDQALNEMEISKLRLGIKSHDEGNLNRAIQYYSEILSVKPNSSETLHEIALSEYTLGNIEKSMEYAIRGQKIDSEGRAAFYHMHGIGLDVSGKPEEARNAFKYAIQLNDSLYLAHYSLAITSLNLGYVNEGISSLKNALRVNFYHSSSHLLLANVYRDLGRNVPAIMAYTYFLFYEPDTYRTQEAYENIHAIFNSATKGSDGDKVSVNLNLFGAMEDGLGLAEIMLSMFSASRFTEENESVSEVEFIAKGYDSLFKTIGENMEDKGEDIDPFLAEYYLPFLLQISESGYMHPMVYLNFQNSIFDGVTTWIDDNWDFCNEYIEWDPFGEEEMVED
jgi:tetratricopeptide (TPR) repeat protein